MCTGRTGKLLLSKQKNTQFGLLWHLFGKTNSAKRVLYLTHPYKKWSGFIISSTIIWECIITIVFCKENSHTYSNLMTIYPNQTTYCHVFGGRYRRTPSIPRYCCLFHCHIWKCNVHLLQINWHKLTFLTFSHQGHDVLSRKVVPELKNFIPDGSSVFKQVLYHTYGNKWRNFFMRF